MAAGLGELVLLMVLGAFIVVPLTFLAAAAIGAWRIGDKRARRGATSAGFLLGLFAALGIGRGFQFVSEEIWLYVAWPMGCVIACLTAFGLSFRRD